MGRRLTHHETPNDWIVSVRFVDARERERVRHVCVAPMFRSDETWHRTDEAAAVDSALRHIYWGVRPLRWDGTPIRVPLAWIPEAVRDIQTRRRHQVTPTTSSHTHLDEVMSRFL